MVSILLFCINLIAQKYLFTGCLNMLCPTSNQHFFRTKLHSKQKPPIFGILSRGDLCMDNQFWGCLHCTASTASHLKDAIFLMIQCTKTLSSWNDIFTAWMIYSISLHGHSFLLRSKIHWVLGFDLWGCFEVIRGQSSKCPQIILISFSYNPNIKMTKKAYMSSVQGRYGGCWGWDQ